MRNLSLFIIIFPIAIQSYYFKRTTYGDAGSSSVDYVNSYYGFPSFNQPSEMRRRPSFGLYPPQQQFLRQEHPFDFGPFGHRIGGANENEQPQEEPQNNIPTNRENAMKKAKPGLWKRGESIRSEIQQKHEQIRRQLAEESADIREKFADLHKRLVAKNLKMMRVSLKKMGRKSKSEEKEEEKLNLKAPEAPEESLAQVEEVKTEQINDQVPNPPQPLVQYPSQQSFSVVESRPIRVSQDGKTIEI
ncbi:unnamed protein product [Caenorhabditis angaria]|uniref:SXP/RAL-2 family protein Ani s 5-like cation-binding domain-containing protein n=1 Tax=Caenorhabditis angaria TaxID=860376 RepID=A0A9P1N022_9PELO|nr:unnamed protein product [Caenorhabditis angaria]